MNQSERLAIAAHMHVLLRRKAGRVTDTVWMASNATYAREMVRFAREQAAESSSPELLDWADRLEQTLPSAPLADVPVSASPAAPRARVSPLRAVAVPPASITPPEPQQPQRYVGGIR